MSFASSNVPPAFPLSYTGQVSIPYIVQTDDPTTSNNQFTVPTIWINKSDPSAHILVAKPGGVADWILFAEESGSVHTIDADSGTAQPTDGILVISGGTTGLTTLASGDEVDLTGVLILANGGTSANLTASNGGIFYSTASAGAILSGTATARQMLQSGSSTTPAWSTTTWPATSTASQILYSSATNTVAGLATANNGVLLTSASGVPSIGNTLGGSFAYTTAAAGSSTFVSITNTDNTNTASHAKIQTVSGGTSGGDSYYSPAIGTTIAYGIGIDNQAVGDPFSISTAAAGDVRPGAGTKLLNLTSAGVLTLPQAPLGVASGGTGATSLTIHGVLLGQTTGAVTATSAGATGTVLIGNTSSDPTFSATPTLTSVSFGGTALSSYISGTFTPTLVGGTASGVTTYSAQVGAYVKIGDQVTVNVHIQLSAATGTGDVKIGGIPYAPYANTAATGAIYFNGSGWAWPVGRTDIIAYLNSSDCVISCTGTAVAAANMQMTNSALEIFFTMAFQSS